jgi:hypothetical protein
MHRYRKIAVRHPGTTEVVIASANKRTLRDATVSAYMDRFKVKKESLLANPGIIADPKLPRKVYVDARLNADSSANFSAKQAQECAPQGRRPRQWGKKKEAFDQVPCGFD